MGEFHLTCCLCVMSSLSRLASTSRVPAFEPVVRGTYMAVKTFDISLALVLQFFFLVICECHFEVCIYHLFSSKPSKPNVLS